jgi:DinB family protein
MDPRLAPLAAIFDLNTDLLLNCLDGLSDAEGRERLVGGGNSITFLAARVGHPLDNPMARYLEGARGFEEVRAWPTLEEVRSAWRSIGTHLQTALASLGPSELSRRHAHRFPLGDSTQLGLIAFLAQHDAYHLGQVAFLRRQLGRPAMSYARPANA